MLADIACRDFGRLVLPKRHKAIQNMVILHASSGGMHSAWDL